MIKISKIISIFFVMINLIDSSFADNIFFDDGIKKYNEKKYEESKFWFQRSIVFNPKDQES